MQGDCLENKTRNQNKKPINGDGDTNEQIQLEED